MPASLPPAQRASKGRHPFLARDSLSECYFASKGAAHVLSSGGGLGIGAGVAGGRARRTPAPAPAGSSDIQLHLQSMFYLLRPEETLKMAVKLESVHAQRTRYLVVVSRASCDAAGNSAGEEACLLGIDCNRRTTVGLVLRVLGDTAITLDGDGGFSVSVCQRPHIFKPVSVQAMWSALQTLHRVSSRAREQNFFQGGASHDWVGYYEEQIESERSCLNEWFAMDSIESRRPPSPDSVRTKPREREETESVIRSTLKEIMMSVDLDEVTSKVIRGRLEEDLDMDLGEFKPFIDQEMITILGQMDSPTEIFDHVYLGSEWNASNLEELQKNGVHHILNVTREIDNFFPGMFDYLNIRVYDDEKTDLLRYWDNTFKYIERARKENSKVLVHCKMGVSRSASVVIAYAMKAFDWSFDTAMKHVKEKRSCIKPNSSFLGQLETYQGILDAMKNKEKLQRSKSETNLKSPGLVSKTDSRNRFTEPAHFLLVSSGRCRGRPRSWSPDTRLASRLLPPTSVSLENLGPETRNKLMPCANGSYSVSQNQIMRLREDGIPSVKHIVNELESQAAAVENETQRVKRNLKLNLANQIDSLKFTLGDAYGDTRDKSGSKSSDIGDINFQYSTVSNDLDVMGNIIQSKDSAGKTEIWDPGENTSYDKIHSNGADFGDDKNLNEIVKCDSGIVDSRPKQRQSGDPFSKLVDRAFEKEENRQGSGEGSRAESGGPPSRQGSFSSCDSAVVCERVSRHSSWGSYDTRPSRNSSCGSYEETWNTGTVKRTKQKLEESSAKRVCSDSDPTICNGIEEAINPILVHKISAPLCDLDIINENHEQLDSINSNKSLKGSNGTIFDAASHPERSNQMSAILKELDFGGSDVAGDVGKRNGGLHSQLSASAPAASCMSFLERHPSPPSSQSLGNLYSPKLTNCGVTVKPLSSHKCKTDILKTGNPAAVTRTLSGKVKNLKMEFEAKSNINNDNKSAPGNEMSLQSFNSSANNNNGKGRSLPSSPVSLHVDKQKQPESEPTADPLGHAAYLEDLSVKVLVGKYDRPKSQQFSTKTIIEPPVPLRKSSLHRDIDNKAQRKQSAPTVRNSILGTARLQPAARRPPVPPNTISMTPVGFPAEVVATVVAKAQTKKQIQHGKTHPLARLKNPTANRCTNPVYNTM